MQVNEVCAQTLLFLSSVALGGVFGVLYDVFRLIRISLSAKKILTAVLDIIYAALCTVIFFLYSLDFGQGAPRLYYAAGALIGLVLYLVTVGLVMGKIMRFLISKIKLLIRLILKPFALLFKYIWNKTENLRKKPLILCKKTEKNLKILLQRKQNL